MKTRDDIMARVEQIRRINDNNPTPTRDKTRGDAVAWVLAELDLSAVDFAAVDAELDRAISYWRADSPWSPGVVRSGPVRVRVEIEPVDEISVDIESAEAGLAIISNPSASVSDAVVGEFIPSQKPKRRTRKARKARK